MTIQCQQKPKNHQSPLMRRQNVTCILPQSQVFQDRREDLIPHGRCCHREGILSGSQKMTLFVLKARNVLEPDYLKECFSNYEPSWLCRPTAEALLKMPPLLEAQLLSMQGGHYSVWPLDYEMYSSKRYIWHLFFLYLVIHYVIFSYE